jgi:protocatechuate 3,4-dioxygenase beta subunit
MPRVTRRRALGRTLAWTVGLVAAGRVHVAGRQGLDQFMASPPCKDEKLTPVVPPQPAFVPDAPARTSLIEPGATGSRVVIAGHVIGLRCGRIKGARVDFWQPDQTGAYGARGSRWRGYQMTDADGRYRLETVAPGAPPGRARHFSARVEPLGKPALTTALYFPGDPGNDRDKYFAPQLVLRAVAGAPPGTYAFDFILDL